MDRIGFGGSCHWCTEAVFQSLIGVIDVKQGWIASVDSAATFSEAVVISYRAELISLDILIAIHLHTHSCTANHVMRGKYRSAVYTFDNDQVLNALNTIEKLQPEFERPIITQVLPFHAFRLNKAEYLNYYFNNPQKPFCQNFVNPKLQELIKRFSNNVKPEVI